MWALRRATPSSARPIALAKVIDGGARLPLASDHYDPGILPHLRVQRWPGHTDYLRIRVSSGSLGVLAPHYWVYTLLLVASHSIPRLIDPHQYITIKQQIGDLRGSASSASGDSVHQLAAYLKEREDFDSLITEEGFAAYRISGDECYIRDIYTHPDYRKKSVASDLADEIARIAISHGCKYLTGSVCTTVGDPTTSAKILLAYGFKIHGVVAGGIFFRKEI